MHQSLIDRRTYRPNRGQPFLERLSLARGRVHEICGPARHTLALIVAGAMTGPVFWCRPGWGVDRLHGPGMTRFLDPGRVTFIAAERPQDLLWTMEEVLRAGVVPLVVADLPGPVALTPMRRMHLAAETGGGRALGVVLTPEGASAGAESRWSFGFAHGAQEGWRLSRLRDRQEPPRAWRVGVKDGGFALGPLSS